MSNGIPDNLSITENTLLRVVDDQCDLIQIISKCPECFKAYKSLIQKKRSLQGGGLTAENSQRIEGAILSGAATTR